MESATLFKLINELIVALASLLWPIVTLIIVLVFRNDLAALLKRVRKGKILVQEMELDPNVVEFQKAVTEAQEEIPESDIENEQFKKESDEIGYLPKHTTKSLQIFWDLRNKIVQRKLLIRKALFWKPLLLER